MFTSKMLRKLLGAVQANRVRRRRHNQELEDIYKRSDPLIKIKVQRIQRAGDIMRRHVSHVLEAEVEDIISDLEVDQSNDGKITEKTNMKGTREDATKWEKTVQERRWRSAGNVAIGPRGLWDQRKR